MNNNNDLSNLNKNELRTKCKEYGMTKYLSKTKLELIELITKKQLNNSQIIENNTNNIIDNNPNNISIKVAEQRQSRQDTNNKLAYDTIKNNKISPNINSINKEALNRLLTYTNYNNLSEFIKDTNNAENNIMLLISLYIAKNASRQGTKDEYLQLEHINTLQEYDITIIKDGKLRPIKTGGFSKFGKHINTLKSIDFIIKHNTEDIGYIMAKVTSGEGGHQDNVLDEIIQFCEWTKIQNKEEEEDNYNIVYVVLYDCVNTSSILFNNIKQKYNYSNLIFTDSEKFKEDFLYWFDNKNKHQYNSNNQYNTKLLKKTIMSKTD